MTSTFKEKRKKRERRIERIRQRLSKKSTPRLVMTVILFATALSGLLTSFILLGSGVSQMWVRYPISILIAYLVFLGQLAIWLWLHGRSLNVDSDVIDLVADIIPTDIHSREKPVSGFGGDADFGGGGSGGNHWTSNVSPAPSPPSGNSTSSLIGFDLDLGDEGCLIVIAIILAIAAVIAGLVASFYIIYIAPALLAEILVDGVLVVSLYRRVKRIEQRHWLRAAIRRTILPAAIVLIFFGVAGYLLQRAVPTAQTIGDVWTHLRSG